jgi:pyruvate/2-oxoglutarate dehydrogenase complex dihydrolipoamide acyltransferase (E2) component
VAAVRGPHRRRDAEAGGLVSEEQYLVLLEYTTPALGPTELRSLREAERSRDRADQNGGPAMTAVAPPGYLSPAVQALIRLHAVDLDGTRGSGGGGRVTLTDLLAAPTRPRPASPGVDAAQAPAPSAPMPDCVLETQVDVTDDRRTDVDIAAAVRRALHEAGRGHGKDVSVEIRDAGATRVVPAVPGGAGAAVGVGAPRWTAAMLLTRTGERVLAPRRLRTVVVRYLAGSDGDALLLAAADAVRSATVP